MTVTDQCPGHPAIYALEATMGGHGCGAGVVGASYGMDLPSVRAPDFPDTLDWIHSGGRRLSLADFRGKLLFLDFWTYG